MKATEVYKFPYPECDPPLVKDSSQIAQMSALANAIDDEVERIDNLAESVLTNPAAARLRQAAVTATTDIQVSPVFVFGDTLFSNPNWVGSVILNGGLDVPEDAWYLVGAHANTDSATAMQVNIRLTLNGSPASSWSNPGSPYTGIFQLPALTATALRMSTGDTLNVQLKHNAAAGTAWNYRAHLWAVKMIAS